MREKKRTLFGENDTRDKVVIIMPTYNGSRFIREQLDSILKQTISNFTLCVFDDQSTDHTIQILEEYAKKDSRIQVTINNRRKGVIQNINDALVEVQADFYFLADQDDIWTEEKLEIQLKILKDKQAIMTFSDLLLIDEKGQFLGQTLWEVLNISPEQAQLSDYIALNTIVTGCSMAFRKELIQYALPIPVEAEMHDHWLSYFASFLGKVISVKESLLHYRQHAQNVIGAQSTAKKRWGKRYKGCDTYREFKKQKTDVLKSNLHQLEAFQRRLKKINKTHPLLEQYIQFYHSLLDGRWGKGGALCLRLSCRTKSSFFMRTLLIYMFFPAVYLVLKLTKSFSSYLHGK